MSAESKTPTSGRRGPARSQTGAAKGRPTSGRKALPATTQAGKTRRKGTKGSGAKGKSRTTRRRRKGGASRWMARIVAAVLLTLFAGLVALLLLTRPGHRGIDVSHHQGRIDWGKVAWTGDIDFAFIKATDGLTFTDSDYQRNHDEARRAGIKVGAYHFFRAGRSGAAQFDHFYRIVGDDIDLRPVLDLEVTGQSIGDPAAYRAEVTAWINACHAQYDCFPLVYASPSFVRDYGLADIIDRCPYWLAWYGHGHLPSWLASRREFLRLLRPDIKAVVWQYSERGQHAGITGPVDLDECWDMSAIEL